MLAGRFTRLVRQAGNVAFGKAAIVVPQTAEAGNGTLISTKLGHPTIEYGGIYAVHGFERNPPAKVRALIGFLLEKLSPSPPWDADLR